MSLRWDDFARACPELAGRGKERLRARELCLVGTLRADGSPRISPVEPDFVAGHLLLGMMWRSRKAIDLQRDPRCVVHSCVCDREGTEGDVKLYGRAVQISDPELRAAYRAAVRARLDWEPTEPDYHLFAIEIESAGFMSFGDERVGMAWDPERGLRRWEVTG